MEAKKPPYLIRPRTAILTRGFDPQLSVGSARPAVFRSSTYVFSSPESAERSFATALGLARPKARESVDLIYARAQGDEVYELTGKINLQNFINITGKLLLSTGSRKTQCKDLDMKNRTVYLNLNSVGTCPVSYFKPSTHPKSVDGTITER